MRFETKVGESGEIVIPEDVRAELRLRREMTVTVQVSPMVSEQAYPKPDWEKHARLQRLSAKACERIAS